MLVLSRKSGEKVVVQLDCGREIVLTVVQVSGYKVRLGFEAPKEINIYRKELADERGMGEQQHGQQLE